MQDSVFMYTGRGLGVSSFTGTGTEFNNISAGLTKVWEMLAPEVANFGLELVHLLYNSATGSLGAKLSNKATYTIDGARFHGELTSYAVGCELLECIRLLGL